MLRLLDRPSTYSAVHKRIIIIQADRKSTGHSVSDVFVNFQSASIVSPFLDFPYFCHLSYCLFFHLTVVFITEPVGYLTCLEPLEFQQFYYICSSEWHIPARGPDFFGVNCQHYIVYLFTSYFIHFWWIVLTLNTQKSGIKQIQYKASIYYS